MEWTHRQSKQRRVILYSKFICGMVSRKCQIKEVFRWAMITFVIEQYIVHQNQITGG